MAATTIKRNAPGQWIVCSYCYRSIRKDESYREDRHGRIFHVDCPYIPAQEYLG